MANNEGEWWVFLQTPWDGFDSKGLETQNTNIIFRGTDGDECEAFVVAIRDLAFAKGKDEDPNWMLRYATTRLRGKALRWHAELDSSIRKDWDLFVQAMFREYPFIEEREQGGIATPVWTSTTFSPAPSTATLPPNDRQLTNPFISPPTDAEKVVARGSQPTDRTPLEIEHVAPPRAYDPSLPGVHTGRLLVIYEEGRQGYHYISASSKRTTSNIQEALIVTFLPSPEAHMIGCINCAERKLGARLSPPGSSKPTFYPLVGSLSADSQVYLNSTWGPCTQDISNIWNISTDGTLNARLPYLAPKPDEKNGYIPSEYFSTTVAYVDISGTTISFVKDDSTSPAEDPSSGLPVLRAVSRDLIFSDGIGNLNSRSHLSGSALYSSRFRPKLPTLDRTDETEGEIVIPPDLTIELLFDAAWVNFTGLLKYVDEND